MLDQSRPDLEGGESGVAGAAQDAQDVELRQGDAFGFEDFGEPSAQDIRGAQQADERLLAIRAEGLGLSQFAQERTVGHEGNIIWQ